MAAGLALGLCALSATPAVAAVVAYAGDDDAWRRPRPGVLALDLDRDRGATLTLNPGAIAALSPGRGSLEGGGTLLLDITGPRGAGTLTLERTRGSGPHGFSLFVATSAGARGGAFRFVLATEPFAPVPAPLPGALALMLGGLAALGFAARRAQGAGVVGEDRLAGAHALGSRASPWCPRGFGR